MSIDGVERRLSAILSADVVGYSRLMAEDEVRTVRELTESRAIVSNAVETHGGRIVDAPGDNVLAEFPSASEAVACAVDVQRDLHARNEGIPQERKMELRIGVHLGEVLVEDQQIYGDGINIAARLEGLAEAGGICISAAVHEQVRAKLPFDFVDLGRKAVKNIPDPVRVFSVRTPAVVASKVFPSRIRTSIGLVGLVVVVALGAAAFFVARSVNQNAQVVETPAAEAQKATLSIAVLPFRNLSPDPDNDYFSAGITEELISKLSRLAGMQVAARSTVARFQNTEQDIKQVGEELGVRYVLEGGVRKMGGRVRISAQLVDCSTGFQLWSNDFDRELDDVFAVQEETALKIAEALDLQLSPGEAEAVARRYTDNVEAYDAYLRGWTLVVSLHFRPDVPEETLIAAEQHFTRALELDPDYALALAGLAYVQGEYVRGGIKERSSQVELATKLARSALALDDQLPQAWAALASAHWNARDFQGSIAHFQESLRLDPDNGFIWCEYASALNGIPDPKKAETAARRACQLEPLYPYAHVSLGYALSGLGRFDEAIEAFEYALQLNSDFSSARSGIWHNHVLRANLHLEAGDDELALAQLQQAGALGEDMSGTSIVPLETLPDALVYVSGGYARAGSDDNSLASLERALARGYSDFTAIDANPSFASLRFDPRFQELLRRYRK